MVQIKIDLSGSGGLSESFAKVPANLNYLSADNQINQGSFNPYIYPGYMAPPRNINKTINQGQTTFIDRACIYDSVNGKFVTGGQRTLNNRPCFNIYNSLDVTTANDSRETSTGNSTIYDFEIYELNGVRKIFYTTFASGQGFIGVLDVSTVNNYNTYNWSNGAAAADVSLYTGTVTGALTFGAPVFLRTASNGFMYAFFNNQVSKIDGTILGGTAGTITPSVLQLDATYNISDAVDWRNNIYIACQSSLGQAFGQTQDNYRISNNCSVFIWDRISSQARTTDFVPLLGVKFINRIFVAPDGELKMICTTSDGYVQIREYDGNSFSVLHELPSTAAPLFWDSVTFSNYATFWLAQDGYIYSHGLPITGSKTLMYQYRKFQSVFQLGRVSSFIASSYSGYLFFGNGITELVTDALIVNYSTNGANPSITQKYLFKANSTPTGYSNSLPGSIDTVIPKSKIVQLPYLATVNEMKVFFATTTSTGVGDETDIMGNIKVYFNHGTTAFKSQNVTKKDLRKGYIRIPLEKMYVNNIQIGIDWTGVTSVGNISGITNDMMPYYAIVDYMQTNARG